MNLWLAEISHLYVFPIRDVLLVNVLFDMSDERKEVWRKFLEQGYPSKKVVFV